MTKRRLLIIFLLVVAFGLGFYAFYAFTKIDVPTGENDLVEETQPSTNESKPVVNTQEPEYVDTQDRTIRDSNVIIKERTQDDIELDGIEEVENLPAGLYTYHEYEYSKGIALTDTDRVSVDPFVYGDSIRCYSKFSMDSDVYMAVNELTTSETIQDIRLNILKNLYISNPEEVEPTPRGTESANPPIVVDDTIKTAIGNGLYIVTKTDDTYSGTVLITYNGRNFRIIITAGDEETVYYYAIELTNNVIHIVN